MLDKPFTFDRVVRMGLTAIVFSLVVALIYILRGVLLPFGVATVIAYLCEPLVQFNRKLLHLKGRTTAVLVTLFGIMFLLGTLAYFFIPSIVKEMRTIGDFIRIYSSSTDRLVPLLPESLHQYIIERINLQAIGDWLIAADWRAIGSWVTSLVSSGVNFIIELFNWLLVLIYVLFIMLDYERLGRGMRALVPKAYRRMIFGLARDLKDSMNHYFRGQALVAFCVGILFSVGFLIMGLPLAVIFGMFIGLLNLVPYLQLVSIPIATLLCMIYSMQTGQSFWIYFGECMAVYVVVQSIQDLFLTPKIMGKVMGLNPAIILLSLSIWGSLLGLLGMIIALPMTTLMISYYERYVLKIDNSK
ncbi:MAG: AI-2E family transporter [Bacteroidales bacterium]|nr:AI-2E family transporter [Bacteroidales bacterium]